MDLAIIQASVSTENRPQFSNLPEGVLSKIFRALFLANMPNSSVYHRSICEADFVNLLTLNKRIGNLLPRVFYETLPFDFRPPATQVAWSPFLVMPSIKFRDFIRTLRMEFRLTDTYELQNYITGAIIEFPITTVDELFTHCADARRLRDLTTHVMGFTDLDVLDIHLSTQFRQPDIQATLAVYAAAGFEVSAHKVTVTAAPCPPETAAQAQALRRVMAEIKFHFDVDVVDLREDWHDDLIAAVAVKTPPPRATKTLPSSPRLVEIEAEEAPSA